MNSDFRGMVSDFLNLEPHADPVIVRCFREALLAAGVPENKSNAA
jgi:hypothetical protein